MAQLIDVQFLKAREIAREEPITREFEAIDNKGRRFGARAYRGSTEFYFETARLWDSCNYRPQREPGVYFYFTPQAMRAGTPYGSSHSTHYFATAEERDAAVEAYFAAAQKRAEKNKARAA